MITISRSLLRQVRSVFRRAGIGKATYGPGGRMLVQSGSDGIRLRGLTHDAAVEYHLPGRLVVEQYVLPSQFLDDCEGRKDQPVTLEASGPDHVAAQFTDGGVPQLLTYQVDRTSGLDGFPGMPEKIDTNEPRLLAGLREALDVTDRTSSRYALGCIHLRGGQGRLVATDGRHVYRHSGFTFPWTDDLLMPGSNVLKSGEFPADQPVGIGRADDWIMLVVGYWTVWLKIDKDGRFPSVESIFPNPAAAMSRLQLAPEDAEFLRQGLGRLPSNDDDYRPVTLDLNGRVAVRAKSPGAPHATELVLAQSHVSGEPLAIATNRYYLACAVAMGFQEICPFGADKPVLCDDGQRQYLWGPLDPKDVIPPDEQAIRVESIAAAGQNGHAGNPKSTPNTNPRRSDPPMETTNINGQDGQPVRRRRKAGHSANAAGCNGHAAGSSPIQQAELLHTSLRDALHKTRDLIVALRREKKQRLLVQTTLASLKQLQTTVD